MNTDTKPSPAPWKVFKAARPGIDSFSEGTVIIYGECDEDNGFENPLDAQLTVAACNSYQLHAKEPIGAAENDLFGQVIERLRYARRFLTMEDHDTAYIDNVLNKLND